MNTDWTVPLGNALTMCDLSQWISLAHGIIKHGRLHCFDWRGDPSGVEIERLLRTYDIHAYGRFSYVELVPDPADPAHKRRELHRYFHVNAQQAEWAEYLLCCKCVPLESVPANPANWNAWGKRLPRPWTPDVKTATMTERISDFLDEILS